MNHLILSVKTTLFHGIVQSIKYYLQCYITTVLQP